MKNILLRMVISSLPILVVSAPIVRTIPAPKIQAEDIFNKSHLVDSREAIEFNGMKFDSEPAFDNYLIENNYIFQMQATDKYKYSHGGPINNDSLKNADGKIENYKELYKNIDGSYDAKYREAMKSYTSNLTWKENYSIDSKKWHKTRELALEDFFNENIHPHEVKFYKYKDRYYNANSATDNKLLKSLGMEGYVIFNSPLIELDQPYIWGTKDSLKPAIKEAVKKNFLVKKENLPEWMKKFELNYFNCILNGEKNRFVYLFNQDKRNNSSFASYENSELEGKSIFKWTSDVESDFDKIFEDFYNNFLFQKLKTSWYKPDWDIVGIKTKLLPKNDNNENDEFHYYNYLPLLEKKYIEKNGLDVSLKSASFRNSQEQEDFSSNMLIAILLLQISEFLSSEQKNVIQNNSIDDFEIYDGLLALSKNNYKYLDKYFEILGPENPLFDYVGFDDFKKYYFASDNPIASDFKGELLSESEIELKNKYFEQNPPLVLNYQNINIYGYDNLVKESNDLLVDRLFGYLNPEFGYYSKNEIQENAHARFIQSKPTKQVSFGYVYGFKNPNDNKDVYYGDIKDALDAIKTSLFATNQATKKTEYSRVYFYKVNDKIKSFVFSSEDEILDFLESKRI
ncbi:hypothetical protein [Spiroplasma alleghenense]|uniref:Uncharacterized protein n=1 Tax=Spiroplasma alleghenense TaxID=216931 RepID=A0A345Z293_9MOLU|nr:hypothetical protein [Spiroplasma alleghenense]AXK50722.1 hypothetical protein SALLE_v1c00460 [Spiroplasma alleghenense]